MLDLSFVRSNPEVIREMLRKRHREDYPFDRLLDLDRLRRALITEAQGLKAKRNIVSSEISEAKKKGGGDPADRIAEMKAISDRIGEADEEVRSLEAQIHELSLRLPNMPDESVPEGVGEEGNVELRRWREPTRFDFKPKDHIDLSLEMGLVDLERAAKVSGARFYFLKEDLVRLNYALIDFGLDFLRGGGWKIVQPPYMLKREAIEGAVILSDFQDVIYKVEGEDLYLIGTSEHALAAMHMDEILDGAGLPLRYVGVSPCFRKEAGAHGRDTKGIFRVHQFEKVEQFVFSKPEESWGELELLIRNAEDFYRALEIPYRVVELCGGELGSVSAKTYDLEVWLPGQNRYREIVSCSNCTDYQARGLRIKFRDKPHEKARFVHTLNSTLVATERTLIAILENYQREGGVVEVPKVLRPYIGGVEAFSAKR